MELQTFNLRNPYSYFFLGTIQIWSRTDQDKTAERLQAVIAKRFKKGVAVCPVLRRA